ncbi:MAG: hypothetical protein ABEN55_16085, partial [Bradymonadaceae bacterium]
MISSSVISLVSPSSPGAGAGGWAPPPPLLSWSGVGAGWSDSPSAGAFSPSFFSAVPSLALSAFSASSDLFSLSAFLILSFFPLVPADPLGSQFPEILFGQLEIIRPFDRALDGRFVDPHLAHLDELIFVEGLGRRGGHRNEGDRHQRNQDPPHPDLPPLDLAVVHRCAPKPQLAQIRCVVAVSPLSQSRLRQSSQSLFATR